jgi:hypothetical protein
MSLWKLNTCRPFVVSSREGQCNVVESVGGVIAIDFRGMPNFDLVDRLLQGWAGDTNVMSSTSHLLPRDRSGLVQTIDLSTGTVSIGVKGGDSVVVELLADRKIRMGDKMDWSDSIGLGAQVYRNVTRGTRMKIYALAHGQRTPQPS